MLVGETGSEKKQEAGRPKEMITPEQWRESHIVPFLAVAGATVIHWRFQMVCAFSYLYQKLDPDAELNVYPFFRLGFVAQW